MVKTVIEKESGSESLEWGGNLQDLQTKALKIKAIPIEDDLQLDWSVGFGSNDCAYFQYCNVEELILSEEPDNKY